MDWNFFALPVSALVLGGLVFVLAWAMSRAYDRKWGHGPQAPGE